RAQATGPGTALAQLSQLNGQNYRKARKSRPLIQRSPLRRPAGTGSDSAAGGCNPGWRLRWQGEVQLPHEHLLLHWQLGVAGQHQRATVGGRETDVEHLDRAPLISPTPPPSSPPPSPHPSTNPHL